MRTRKTPNNDTFYAVPVILVELRKYFLQENTSNPIRYSFCISMREDDRQVNKKETRKSFARVRLPNSSDSGIPSNV